MNLRLVVGGLLARDAVLGTLLLNYADRLQRGVRGSGTTPPCFIVPAWVGDFRSIISPESEVLKVEVHTFRGDPRRGHDLDVILRLLDRVLTRPAAGEQITARRVETSPETRDSGAGTVFKIGAWEIACAAVPAGSG